MLATRVNAAPAGNGWLHEIKHDGYRMLCRVADGQANFISRNGLRWTMKLPDLVSEAAKLPGREVLLDGELACLLDDGRSCFDSLQDAIAKRRCGRLVFMAFDVLYWNGRDLRDEPIEYRKECLAELVPSPKRGRIWRVEHIIGDGPDFFAECCRLGLEGIVSKQLGRSYQSGRSRAWLKAKWAGWKPHGENWR